MGCFEYTVWQDIPGCLTHNPKSKVFNHENNLMNLIFQHMKLQIRFTIYFDRYQITVFYENQNRHKAFDYVFISNFI